MDNFERDSYYFSSYIYGENEQKREEALKNARESGAAAAWDKWRCAILVETERSFFDTVRDTLPDEIRKGTRRKFDYYNLNSWQSVLLFSDEHCDYQLVAKQLYVFLKRRYTDTLHLAVSSRFEGCASLPEIFRGLDRQMEEKYYHPDIHVFTDGEDAYGMIKEEVQDSRLLELISGDISRKNVEKLCSHFECLVNKYQNDIRYSGMYVKFVFSSVIQELFWEPEFARDQNLKEEIDKLYSCGSVSKILEVAKENIEKYCSFINETMEETRQKIHAAKDYIAKNCSQPLDMKMIAGLVGMSQGYLGYIFQKETGMSIQRYIRVCRMELAEKLLGQQALTVEQVSESTGFFNVNYFCKSYYDFYGRLPGEGEPEV